MPRAAKGAFAVLIAAAVLYHGNRQRWLWCLVSHAAHRKCLVPLCTVRLELTRAWGGFALL